MCCYFGLLVLVRIDGGLVKVWVVSVNGLFIMVFSMCWVVVLLRLFLFCVMWVMWLNWLLFRLIWKFRFSGVVVCVMMVLFGLWLLIWWIILLSSQLQVIGVQLCVLLGVYQGFLVVSVVVIVCQLQSVLGGICLCSVGRLV